VPEWELSNPSDHITLVADDFEVAAVAAVALGMGNYGLVPIAPEVRAMPIFLFGSAEVWFQETFNATLDQVMARVTAGEAPALVACLDSVVVGDRRVRDAALAAIPEGRGRDAFLATWDDQHRTSMNDIVGKARKLARGLKGARPAT
jgi:hypothetical protein